MEDNEFERKVAIVAAAHGVAASAIATIYFCLDIPREPHINRNEERDTYMNSILTNEVKCRDNLRMGSYAFIQLCALIGRQRTIDNTDNCSLEEMVMRFLHLLSHDVRHRVLGGRFYRSGETISRQFNQVLNCVVKLYKCLVADHLDVVHGGETPPQISNDPRFAKYFKGCLGALDGTHVNANVPLEEQDRFRGRKVIPTQNVLAACSFDLRFTYILVGWEGSAHDQKVLDDALVRSNPFVVPHGKYYLVDGGYTHQPGFLAPYRGICYHLNETKGRKPQNEKELFNKRHSGLRNAIERAFGVMKKRWPMLSHDTFYPYKTQVKIVLACFVLHNHIMAVDPEDSFLKESDKELAASKAIENDESAPSTNQASWVQFREDLAKKMFVDYNKRKK